MAGTDRILQQYQGVKMVSAKKALHPFELLSTRIYS